jgi:hypothetical protein
LPAVARGRGFVEGDLEGFTRLNTQLLA